MNTIPPNVKNDARQDDRRDAGKGGDEKNQAYDDKKGRKDPSSGKDMDEDKDEDENKDEDMDNVVSQRSVKQ